ncbi:MAG: chorismate-binding protein, partial [Myxococcota bacterium]|nr:chorismate-binding protein [Myxococcota bacterium]
MTLTGRNEEQAVLAQLRRSGTAIFDVGSRWLVATWGDGEPIHHGPDWMTRARESVQTQGDPRVPFCGGLVGWLGYEVGSDFERMPCPRGPRPIPDLCLWRVDGALCLDRLSGRWHCVGTEAFQAEGQSILERAQDPTQTGATNNRDLRAPDLAQASRPLERERYEAGVRTCLEAIGRGDVYQVNLSWQERGPTISDPLQTWLDLRQSNPSERSAYLRMGPIEILSNSPELFVEVEAGAEDLHVTSTPIKGTLPAEEDPSILLDSTKERAELTMITDLVRNDLGRIAQPGSIHADSRQIRRCGDLWHAEQRVQARVARGRDSFDVVAACFPPGSV